MRFTVRWTRSALNELTVLWTEAGSAFRQAITAATHEIDQRLASDPENEGESREDTLRVLFVFPLTIRYEVDVPGRIVRVMHVRAFRWRE